MARGVDDVMDAVICGIDPGLGTTGYAVVCGDGRTMRVLDAGACRFDRNLPLPERLVQIERDLDAVFAEQRPTVVAVEELYAHYKHPRTAVRMAHARGVILATAARAGMEVRSYAATQVKRYLTGSGRATKAQMQRAIQHTLGLDHVPEPEDMADALAIALCCDADLRRRDVVVEVSG
ncbi:MAG: crossover junction endodeoxyribonuclease RuvC [Phycisphaerae bacterium]